MFACLYAPGLEPARRHLLKECAQRFSPHIEDSGTNWLVLDIRGLGRLIGGPLQIASALAEEATRLGFAVNAAIAPNPQAAVAAARGRPGITIVSGGDEQNLLGQLPLELLSPSDGLRDTLDTWGVRTFADLAKLPHAGIAERLGAEGLHLYRLTRGKDVRPLIPSAAPDVYEEFEELEHPLDLLEPLAFILGRMLNSLCAKLRSHGFAANELHLMLRLDDRSEYTRTLRLPFAGRDPNTFLKLLQMDLAAHPPHAAIVAARLNLRPVEPRAVQGGLFIPLAPEPEKLELTIARIHSIVGAENAGIPELLDTHRPDAVEMLPVEFSRQSVCAAPSDPRLAMRRFRPPLAAKVDAPFGVPKKIQARGVSGNVRTSGGPWRISGDWWATGAWYRDEWDVALDNGALYRVYRQQHGDWYIDGNYD